MSKIVREHNFSMPYIIVCSVFLLNLQNDNKKNVILSGFHQPFPVYAPHNGRPRLTPDNNTQQGGAMSGSALLCKGPFLKMLCFLVLLHITC